MRLQFDMTIEDENDLQVLSDVVVERDRQREKGYDAAHDDTAHELDTLIAAAGCYIVQPGLTAAVDTLFVRAYPDGWPIKRSGSRRWDLIRGIAMLVAAVGRIDRAIVARAEKGEDVLS